MAGCVYAMVIPEWRNIRRIGRRGIERDLLKIGHVISPENLRPRRASLSWQYAVEFVGLYAVETRSYIDSEASLHSEFAARQVRVDNRLGGEGREFFDMASGEAISALKSLRNARVVKPTLPWSISGKVGQRFRSEELAAIEQQEGIEEWEDGIIIYVLDGYDGNRDLTDDEVWFGQDIPNLRVQEGYADANFEAVAKVTLSGNWDFLPDEPGSDFPFCGIVRAGRRKEEPWIANQVLHNEVGEGVTVVPVGRHSMRRFRYSLKRELFGGSRHDVAS